MMRAVMSTIVLLAAAPLASAQSFDCKKAQTPVEKMICASPQLAELDEHLGRYYPAARDVVQGAASCLQSDQSQWLKSVRNVCQNDACLKTAYLSRLAELDGLQPGASAIKNITLPNVPTLVWIVPSALDRVAAPPKPNAKPLEITGALVNEVASGGDGFVIRTRDGVKVPLVLLMFLEGSTQPQLEGLAKQKDLTVRARGYAASDGKRAYFEPSRCTFIHRMPATR
jgi:uncharacterized protein